MVCVCGSPPLSSWIGTYIEYKCYKVVNILEMITNLSNRHSAQRELNLKNIQSLELILGLPICHQTPHLGRRELVAFQILLNITLQPNINC